MTHQTSSVIGVGLTARQMLERAAAISIVFALRERTALSSVASSSEGNWTLRIVGREATNSRQTLASGSKSSASLSALVSEATPARNWRTTREHSVIDAFLTRDRTGLGNAYIIVCMASHQSRSQV